MNFVVSSTELFTHLQAINRVISSKNSLPILDSFLFNLAGKKLTFTASDLESTLVTSMELNNVEGEGVIAIEARRLLDILKEFSEQPLNFQINMENYQVDILSQNGKFSLVGQNGADFPTLPSIQKGKGNKVGLSNEAMLTGINKALFATADDELRPVMNGIFIEISPEEMCFVASDAHKLVRYKRMDVETKVTAAFILPKKPASLLKNLLPKEMGEISLEFDEKNAIISGAHFKLICRLVEGNYPAYNTVIPQNNPNRMVIDRVEFYNTLRRVSVFSNPATNLVRLKISGNEVNISAQDIDFAISAYERVNCAYEGDPMEIGFKSVFLLEILSNISSSDIAFQLSDPTRAGIIVPAEHDNENEDVLMLLMPMMLTDL